MGPIPNSPVNRRFLAVFGEARPQTALLLPILVAGRVAAILYVDAGADQAADAKFSHLQSVIHGAGMAFQRIIVTRKSHNLRK